LKKLPVTEVTLPPTTPIKWFNMILLLEIENLNVSEARIYSGKPGGMLTCFSLVQFFSPKQKPWPSGPGQSSVGFAF
jgi:hypothetical protein